jgi:phosphohistidine phosphatase
MRRLLLLRHAKSDHAPGMRDLDRVLNSRGREDAPRIGAYIARHGLHPDRVLCSTAVRARETWTLLAQAFDKAPAVVFEARLYEANPDTILDLLRATPAKVHTLIVVGHNPSLHQLANALIASGDVEARERLREKLPTSALVGIDLAIDDWAKLHPAAGRLDRFITPRLLDPATD